MADEGTCVGKRVVCDGSRGTVKYFGEVPPTAGEWFGVEWDDENRGKHDGTLDGVSYFTCSHPKNGSFVRLKKVEFGVSVVDALRLKYGDDVQKHIQDLHVVGIKQKTEVEMVGAETVWKVQSCFEKLTDISLSNQNVRGPDKDLPLHSFAPMFLSLIKNQLDIINLDLSGNLLCSWEDVAEVVHNLTNLKMLNVSNNRLTMPSDISSLKPSFCYVKELFLNKMKMSWEEISAAVRMFPNLENLHVCYNSIYSLRVNNSHDCSDLLSCYQNIVLLDLYGNNLTDWDEILDLGVLSRLSTLILANNKFSEVRFDNSQGPQSTMNFSSVKSLNLSENQIKDISSINALNMLPLLEELRVKDNPVFEGLTSFASRQELIARISSLQIVNGSPVTGRERKAAEQAYIKKFAKDWLFAGGKCEDCDSNKLDGEFLIMHPRYLELLKAHGAPDTGSINKTSTTLKDSLIALTFKCPNDSSKKVITKKLPGTMTIGKVKGLLYRLYKVDSADQTLSYLDT
ncbi:hypothetical protein QZH41_014374, partial [Actinostola sp. cb2023]